MPRCPAFPQSPRTSSPTRGAVIPHVNQVFQVQTFQAPQALRGDLRGSIAERRTYLGVRWVGWVVGVLGLLSNLGWVDGLVLRDGVVRINVGTWSAAELLMVYEMDD